MSHLSVHLIPRDPKSDSDWAKYAMRMKPVRLRSLKNDSECFISKYEYESKEPDQFWIDRMKDPTTYNFVLVRAPDNRPVKTTEDLLREDVEWIGFNASLELRKLSKKVLKREGGNVFTKSAEWYLAALYIDEKARGKGSGRLLIQKSIDTMREVEQEGGHTGSLCEIGVMNGNYRALHLYESVGFVVKDPNAVEEKDGRKYSITSLEMKL